MLSILLLTAYIYGAMALSEVKKLHDMFLLYRRHEGPVIETHFIYDAFSGGVLRLQCS